MNRQTAPPLQAAFDRPELDVLRFCAFLAVFLYHTIGSYTPEFLIHMRVPPSLAPSLLTVVRAGEYGVDLFFALSAYLITVLLLRERESTGRLHVGRFYLRRALRIWPLYFLLVVLFRFVPFFNADGAFDPYFPAFMFFLGNWAFTWWGWPHSPADPLWSISVEEQFYLLWPPIVARLSRRGLILATCLFIGIANITRAMSIGQPTLHLWANTFAHLDVLGAGILLAVVMGDRVPQLQARWRAALILGGIACLVLRSSQEGLQGGASMTLSMVLLGYPAVTIGCIAILVGVIGVKIRWPRMQYLGKISYGLYAWHSACIMAFWPLVARLEIPYVRGFEPVIALLMTIGVAAVSYQWIERPFLKLKRRFSVVASRPV